MRAVVQRVSRASVTVDGETVSIRLFWVGNNNSWFMDIRGISFDMEFTGIRCCTNDRILGPYAVREIGEFIFQDLEQLGDDPDYDGLGTRFQLTYYTKEETGYDLV